MNSNTNLPGSEGDDPKLDVAQLAHVDEERPAAVTLGAIYL